MGVVPKWLRDWIARMRPSQHSSGDGALNIERMRGNVSTSQTTHHVRVVHNHNHIYAPPAEPPPPRRTAQPLTDVHREALALMDPLSKRTRMAVLDFMVREFGTRMVKELTAHEARRVCLYLRQVRANKKREGSAHELL